MKSVFLAAIKAAATQIRLNQIEAAKKVIEKSGYAVVKKPEDKSNKK